MNESRACYIFILVSILSLLFQSWIPLALEIDSETQLNAPTKNIIVWDGDNQPWAQFGHNPTRNSTVPAFVYPQPLATATAASPIAARTLSEISGAGASSTSF